MVVRNRKPKAPRRFRITPNINLELEADTMELFIVCSISGAMIKTRLNWQVIRKMAEWLEKVGEYAINLSEHNKRMSQKRCDKRYRAKKKAEQKAVESLKRLQLGNYKYYKARNDKAWKTRQRKLAEDTP